jgi:hypothetical protein
MGNITPFACHRVAMDTLLFYTPYKDARLDNIYNLQFCDNADLLHAEYAQQGVLPQLIKQELTPQVLQSLAMNGDEDSRVRILAFQQMRQKNLAVPQKILLAVIVEVGLAEGLETLAVYDDLRVRYINARKRLALVESPTPAMETIILQLYKDAQSIINGLQPSNHQRHPAPTYGRAKLTFIASDGVYLGEGQFKHMQENPQAARLIDDSLDLLHEIIITGQLDNRD